MKISKYHVKIYVKSMLGFIGEFSVFWSILNFWLTLHIFILHEFLNWCCHFNSISKQRYWKMSLNAIRNERHKANSLKSRYIFLGYNFRHVFHLVQRMEISSTIRGIPPKIFLIFLFTQRCKRLWCLSFCLTPWTHLASCVSTY